MLLEVCVDSLESATNAVYNGADEVEVCSNLSNGGLTPSFEMVKQIIDMKPKVNVMIRCREGWDFCYNDQEMSLMLHQISDFKSLDVDRFVFGGLTKAREVDISTCEAIVTYALPKPVTFHRAFDHCKDSIKAIEDIIQLGFSRVLTSGQGDSAAQTKAIKLIKVLLDRFGADIQIMPGAGINAQNAKIFTKLGCSIIHGSFKRERFTSSDEIVYVTDGQMVQEVKSIIGTC